MIHVLCRSISLFHTASSFLKWIQVSDICHFPSCQVTYFSIFYKVGLLGIKSLCFCLSKNIFLLHVWKIITIDALILYWYFLVYLFQYALYFTACFCLYNLWQKVHYNYYPSSFTGKIFFPMASCSVSSFSFILV